MSRISQVFNALRAEQKCALIPFITAGDPHPDSSVAILHALVEGGADIIELGVPFSDPMADGPVIQRASERALEHAVSLTDVLSMVSQFREQNSSTPIVLMGYLNPIESMGYEQFVQQALAAGVDGVLIVDMPPEETGGLTQLLQQHELDQVFLIAPTTEGERLHTICQRASGFVYYVSLKGVTGSSRLDTAAVKDKLQDIRRHTQLPLGVGFGIKDAETAAAIASFAEAVVVGSALVERLYASADHAETLPAVARDFIAELRSGIDQV